MNKEAKSPGTLRERERERELQFSEINSVEIDNIDYKITIKPKS